MATVARKKLHAPESATTLEEAVRLTLSVMASSGDLVKYRNTSTLSVQIWHRLTRANFKSANISAVERVLRALVEQKALSFGSAAAAADRKPRTQNRREVPVKDRRAAILAGQ